MFKLNILTQIVFANKSKGETMELKFRLLEHPFYQAWNCGEISEERLANYANSYNEFIDRIPDYWTKIVNELGADKNMGNIIIEEETDHISLWHKWSKNLPEAADYPRMNDLINGFDDMTASELLGAVHAFEIQQPEVAATKKKGLLEHYGFSEEDVTYFDEHENEDEHIAFGSELATNNAKDNEFQRGFDKGSKLIYESLNLF